MFQKNSLIDKFTSYTTHIFECRERLLHTIFNFKANQIWILSEFSFLFRSTEWNIDFSHLLQSVARKQMCKRKLALQAIIIHWIHFWRHFLCLLIATSNDRFCSFCSFSTFFLSFSVAKWSGEWVRTQRTWYVRWWKLSLFNANWIEISLMCEREERSIESKTRTFARLLYIEDD